MAPSARYAEMDLRLSDFRLNIWQIAALGAVIAMASGVAVGGYFKSGYSLAAPASGDSRLIVGDTVPEPVQYMTDASGRIPDYVLGTDYTNPPAPEPAFVAYEPEPLPAGAPEASVQPISYAEPAAPPSVGGDILAGLHPAAANENGAGHDAQPTPVVAENEAGAADVRARSPEPVTVAAAY